MGHLYIEGGAVFQVSHKTLFCLWIWKTALARPKCRYVPGTELGRAKGAN